MLKANEVGGSGSRIWSSDGEGFGGGPPLSPILPPMPSKQPPSPRFLQLARRFAPCTVLRVASLLASSVASLPAPRFARCLRSLRSLRGSTRASILAGSPGSSRCRSRDAPAAPPPLWGEGMTDRKGRDDSVVTCRPLSGAPRSTISVVGATRYVEARARTDVRREVGQGPAT